MAFSPISFTAPNYRDYKNWWLKAYYPGTTTPKSMALDAAGASFSIKLQLDKDGFIVSGGGAKIIPYINGAYDLWLFQKETEADNNDTSTAIRLADNISADSSNPDGLPTFVEQIVTLTAGQTTVNFPGISAARANIFVGSQSVDRGYLIKSEDYTVTSESTIELKRSFSAGTLCVAISDLITSAAPAEFVRKYNTLSEAVNDSGITIFDVVWVKERVAGSGVSAVFYVVAASSVTANTFNFVECIGAPALALALNSNGEYNVRQWGAIADGVTDDQPAIQAAVDYATTNGGKVIAPSGYYLLKAPVNIGAPFYINDNDVSFIVERTDIIDDATDIAKQDGTNKAANALLKRIDFECTSSTYFVADFEPTVFKPVIAYNLDNDSFDNAGKVSNVNVIAKASFVAGKYDNSVTYTENKLVGLYTGRGCSVSDKALFAGVGVGYVSHRQYWTGSENFKAYHCGDAFHFSAYNQASAKNFNAHTCLRAYIFDGQVGELTQFGTENCDEDLIVLRADSCSIGPAYLEDVRASGGAGKYTVSCGITEASAPLNEVVHTQFNNVIVLNVLGTEKKGYRFWSCDKVTANQCRAYGSDSELDATSTVTLNGCDSFGTPDGYFIDGERFNTFTPELKDSFGNLFTLNTVEGRVSFSGRTAHVSINLEWITKGAAIAGSAVIVSFEGAFPTFKSESSLLQGGFITTDPVIATVTPTEQFMRLNKIQAGAAPQDLIVSDLQTTGSLNISMSFPASLFG